MKGRTGIYKALYTVCLLLVSGALNASAQGIPRPTVPDSQSTEQAGTPTDDWAVMLIEGSDPNTVAQSLGFENQGNIAGLPNTYLFRYEGSATTLRDAAQNALQSAPEITWYEQQFAVQQEPRPDGEVGSVSGTGSTLALIVSVLVYLVLIARVS